MTTQLCGRCGQTAAPNSLVCTECEQATINALRALPVQYVELLAAHIAANPDGGPAVKHAPGSSTPYRDAIGDIRIRIKYCVFAWTAYVTYARKLRIPEVDAIAINARVLRRQAAWLFGDKNGTLFAKDFIDLTSEAALLLAPLGRRRFALPAQCPKCGGQFRATLRKDGDEPSEIQCTNPECRYAIPSSEWIKFGEENRR